MPRPSHQHARLRLPFAETVSARVAALAVVGAIGALTLGVSGTSLTTKGAVASVAAGGRHPVGVSAARVAQQRRTAAEAARSQPHAKAPAHHTRKAAHATHAAAAGPWMPSGTGMWIYEWKHTNRGDAASIVHRARHFGLSTLYLRTGSSWDGLNGGRHLASLLHASSGTNVHIVAWDFPRLRRPWRDAVRLAHAARITAGPHAARVTAVAPDIETPAEGTFNAAWRVRLYLRTLRARLPHNVSILTAVPWPSRFRVGNYPYATVAAHSNALVPMAYWYNNAPTVVTARSMSYLRKFHRPVLPVGQGYDGKLDVPSLRHNNLRVQVPAFLRTARQHGARAVSLWSWQAAPAVAWNALWRYREAFSAHH